MKRLKMAIAALLAFALLPLIWEHGFGRRIERVVARGTDSRGSKH